MEEGSGRNYNAYDCQDSFDGQAEEEEDKRSISAYDDLAFDRTGASSASDQDSPTMGYEEYSPDEDFNRFEDNSYGSAAIRSSEIIPGSRSRTNTLRRQRSSTQEVIDLTTPVNSRSRHPHSVDDSPSLAVVRLMNENPDYSPPVATPLTRSRTTERDAVINVDEIEDDNAIGTESAEELAREVNLSILEKQEADAQLQTDEQLALALQQKYDMEQHQMDDRRERLWRGTRFSGLRRRETSFPYNRSPNAQRRVANRGCFPRRMAGDAGRNYRASTSAHVESRFNHWPGFHGGRRLGSYHDPCPFSGVNSHYADGDDLEGDIDSMGYDELLQLSERIGDAVPKGASGQAINRLPTKKYSTKEHKGKDQSTENTSCSICMQGYQDNEKLTTLPCTHCFHRECVSKWLKVNASCPVCRINIK
eukprot:Nk52_evm23s270 gene=Nk52_evmTU23s270